jgi:phosphoribosylamine--glycine ligase
MGDPETQSVISRIDNDVVELFSATWEQKLSGIKLHTNPKTAVTVVVASKGYPADYPKGETITGLDSITESTVFQAGTKLLDNETVSNGGRVLTITSLGDSIDQARDKSYKSIEKIEWKSKYFRTDIGNDLKNFTK